MSRPTSSNASRRSAVRTSPRSSSDKSRKPQRYGISITFSRRSRRSSRGASRPKSRAEGLEVQDVADELVTGVLAKRFPDHVKARKGKTLGHDASRLRLYINPIVGPIPLLAITLDHCDEVMRSLPDDLEGRGRAVTSRRC